LYDNIDFIEIYNISHSLCTPEEKRKQELIDELIKDYDGPESFWGESGIFADLKKRIVERTLDVEMDDHLGYSKLMFFMNCKY
jgi:hypothetical protein